MILSFSKELAPILIPHHEGQISMLPFDLSDITSVPDKFKSLVIEMISYLPIKKGIAFLTIDGKQLKPGEVQRLPKPHIDGNYAPHYYWDDKPYWSNVKDDLSLNSDKYTPYWNGSPSPSGPYWNGGSKMGKNSEEILSSIGHKLSYETHTGGMLLASTVKGCIGWNGIFDQKPGIGGDCSHIPLPDPFTLKPNVLYYGTSQFIHESIPVQLDSHRIIARITLPMNYKYIN